MSVVMVMVVSLVAVAVVLVSGLRRPRDRTSTGFCGCCLGCLEQRKAYGWCWCCLYAGCDGVVGGGVAGDACVRAGGAQRCWCKGFRVTCGLGGGRWRVTGVAGGGGGRA